MAINNEDHNMLSVLISGKLAKDPRTGTGKNGSPWTSASVRVPVQPDSEGAADSIFCSVIAFGDEAAKLARLSSGDAVSIAGTAKLSTWTGKDGVTKPTMDVQATGILTVYQVKKRRGNDDAQSRLEREPQRSHERQEPHPDFDDPIRF